MTTTITTERETDFTRKGLPPCVVPGRAARTLAQVWRLTPAEVAAEHERLKRFPNAARPKHHPSHDMREAV